MTKSFSFYRYVPHFYTDGISVPPNPAQKLAVLAAARAHGMLPVLKAPGRKSWSSRRRLLAILRLAVRLMVKGRRSKIGALGRGASVAAVLAALGISLPQNALAQYAAGGSVVPAVNSNAQQVLNRATGTGVLNYPTTNSGSTTPQGVAIGTTDTSLGGGTAVGFNNTAGTASFAAFAFGNENLANGAWGVAMGNGNTASNTSAIAIGTADIASGNTSIALGRQSTSSGNFSIAQGNVTTASAVNAIALGNSAQATASGAIVIGSGSATGSNNFDATASQATGINSLALGVSTFAAANDAIAIGDTAKAGGIGGVAIGAGANSGTNNQSLAIGAYATAIGDQSTALGNNVVASGNSSVAIGGDDLDLVASTRGALYTSLTGGTLASGIYIPTSAGDGSVAIGVEGAAPGNFSTAIGLRSAANGDGSFAIGAATSALGQASGAIGLNASATGLNAIAVGVNTQSSASYATAIGSGGNSVATSTRASAIGATAIGGNSASGALASGTNAIAIGGQAIASNTEAVAIGKSSAASGSNAIAIGQSAIASARQTIAIGFQNNVSGTNSGAFGDPNNVSGAGSYAFGNNNSIAADYAFALGNNISIAAGLNGSVGIGDNSTVAAVSNAGPFTLTGGSIQAAAPAAVVSIGATGSERRITNLAAGNLTAGSTDAVNGSQLFAVAKASNNLGSTIAAAFGGGMAVNADGTPSLPASYTVGANTYNSVAGAISALSAAGGSVKYFNVNSSNPDSAATGTDAVAIGPQASAAGFGAIAIGSGGTATAGPYDIAIGGSAGAGSDAGNFHNTIVGGLAGASLKGSGNSIFGEGSGQNVSGVNNAVVGYHAGNSVTGDQNTFVGAGAGRTVAGTQNIGIGKDVAWNVTGNRNIAIGALAGRNISADQTLAIGAGGDGTTAAQATSASVAGGIAIGGNSVRGAQSSAADAIAIGGQASAGAAAAVALGKASSALGADSLAVGTLASAQKASGIALGSGASATNAGDVALGAGSLTASPGTGAFSLNGGAIAATSPSSVVSVGASGAERQITNVAAGVLTASSTNAVNGSQLFAVGTALNTLGAGTAAALGGGAAVAADGTVTAPAYAVAGKTYADIGSALSAQGRLGVQYAPGIAGNPTALVDLASNANLPALTKAVSLTGVAAGVLTASSTDAVNGSQLFALGTSQAASLGGGAKFDAATGKVLNPAYTIGAASYADVGSALSALDGSVNGGAGIKYFHATSVLADSSAAGTDSVAIGPKAVASGINAIAFGQNAIASKAFSTAIGNNSSASAAGGLALGDGAVSTVSQGVALGSRSADAANVNSNGFIIASGPSSPVSLAYANAANTVAGAVSVGSAGNYRQVQNVADGAAAHDAVTVQQLSSVVTAANAALLPLQATSKLAVQYAPDASGNATPVIDLASNATLPAGTKTVTLTGVAPGALAAMSVQAVNGSQVFALGSSTAASLGAGAAFDPSTGKIIAPAYSISGNTYNDVGSAIAAIDSSISGGAAVKYFHANSSKGDATASGADSVAIGPLANASGLNSVALGANSTDGGLSNVVSIGAAGQERKLINLAAGAVTAASTDAISGGQLNAVSVSVASALGGGAAFDTVTGRITAPVYTIAGASYSNAGSAFAALDSSVNGGGGVKYFHASSTLADSSATGVNSVAIGPAAVSSGSNSVAIGAGSADGGRANVVSVGSAGAERKIINVAAGSAAAASTEAVNGSQLNSALSSAAAALGGGAGFDAVTGKVKAPSYTIASRTYGDVGSALAAQDKLSVQYAADPSGNPTAAINLAGHSGLPAGVAAVALTGVANATTSSGAVALGQLPVQYSSAGAPTAANPAKPSNDVTLVGASAGPVVIHNVGNGALDNDAVNVSQLKAVAGNALLYGLSPAGNRTNTAVLAGGDAAKGVTITNLAAGVNPSDAVNVSQINNLSAYTQNQVQRLDAKIDTVKGAAFTGAAIALAAAGLRYNDQPGKSAAAGAISTYKGKVGMALGLGHTSENGRWRYNISASFAPANLTRDIGMVAAASYTFN